MRPKHHNAVAVLRRQLTEYASFSAGPASLVVSLLAILHVLDKGISFRARPRRCRRKEKGRSTMSNARHTLHCRSLLFLSSTLTLPWRLSAPFVDHTAHSVALQSMCSSLCECQEASYNGTSRAIAYLAQLLGGTMLPYGNITDGRRRHSTSQERLLRTRTKEKERGRGEGQLQVRPKQHDAVAAPRRQLTKRVVSSAGPAALVVLLLAIVSIPDRVASFLARACSCRERKRDGAQ